MIFFFLHNRTALQLTVISPSYGGRCSLAGCRGPWCRGPWCRGPWCCGPCCCGSFRCGVSGPLHGGGARAKDRPSVFIQSRYTPHPRITNSLSTCKNPHLFITPHTPPPPTTHSIHTHIPLTVRNSKRMCG